MSRRRILLAEDSAPTRARLEATLQERGYAVSSARDGSEALARFEREPVDLVLSDQRMPRLDGLGLLRALRARHDVPFLLYSADAAPDVAFHAARLGASAFLAYPFAIDEQLIPAIDESLVAVVPAPANDRLGAARFVGTSAAAAHVRDRIRRLAPTRATVLILGETGVGKEVVARALHEESGRSVLRCFAVTELAESLLEAELFGHERGAFTGAVDARAGLIEQAQRGTLLLDEIGDAPPALQAKLLRVLESGELRRIGGNQPRKLDVRVLAATHRDLERDRRSGRFRPDLYYRLHQAVITVPPLRERPEDIEVLARALLVELAAGLGTAPPQASPAFFAALCARLWPGNARELRSALQAVLLWSDGHAALEPGDLSEALLSLGPAVDAEEQLQRQRLLAAWRAAGGNQEAARRTLGLTRAAWRHRWRRLGLRADTKGTS